MAAFPATTAMFRPGMTVLCVGVRQDVGEHVTKEEFVRVIEGIVLDQDEEDDEIQGSGFGIWRLRRAVPGLGFGGSGGRNQRQAWCKVYGKAGCGLISPWACEMLGGLVVDGGWCGRAADHGY
eukprot:1129043-Rhodomonas_salina.2